MTYSRLITSSWNNTLLKNSAVPLPSDKPGRSPSPQCERYSRPLPAVPLSKEILHKIFFEYSLLVTPVTSLPPQRDLYPWILGHVCRMWREALWESPHVWSTIHIIEPCSRDFQRHETLVWKLLSTIIARTTTIISLIIERLSYSPFGISIIIKSFSHRFRSLTIYPSSQISLNALLELKPKSLPHLENLSIFNFGSSIRLSTRRPSTNHLHLNLPKLRTLVIDGKSLITPYLHYFPFSRLTYIKLTGYTASPDIIYCMLQQCTSIIDATFSISEGVTDILSCHRPETISSPVEHITLLPRFTIDWNLFLSPLSLPSLTTFAISIFSRSPVGLGPTFTPAMVSLIDQSGCSLQSFSISYDLECSQDTNLPHPDITDLLPKMPSLETFISGYVAAPESIRTVHISLVQLESVSWRVEPGGLSALLDLLDDNISRKTLSNFPCSIHVVCGDEDEFQSVHGRLIQDYATYEEAGFNITVRNFEGDDIRLIASGGDGSDDHDIGSKWASESRDDEVSQSYCCCLQ